MTYFVTVPRRMQSKGEHRRADILAVARRVLVGGGYDRFVLRESAGRVGVMLGNLQYYYATRDDLLEAVIRAEFAVNSAEIVYRGSNSRARYPGARGLCTRKVER